MASGMAWYRGGTTSAGDEFFENQTAGWSLWTFSASDEQDTTGAYSDRREEGRRSDEGPAPLEEEPGFTQPTEEIFLSQFSDEEMRRMDAPFEPLDMFPDSMHRLLSYENMLTGVLTGSEDGDGDGVDAMDTCGFPLFSHDLQTGEQGIQLADPASEEDKAGPSTTKRSRFIADGEGAPPGFEALVLEELEDVVFQLTKRTRMCYRDAFYRLAESSKANCSTADSAAQVDSTQSFHGTASRSSTTTPGCHERETNPIDRTVMVFTMKPPQLHGNCFSDDHEAQSTTTTWTARA